MMWAMYNAAGIFGETSGTIANGTAHAAPYFDHFGDARCIALLRALVADPVPRIRRMALHALSCETCKLAPLPGDTDLVGLLTDYALHDPSIKVRRHATYGLASRRDDPRAAAVLEQLRGSVADPMLGRYLRRIAGHPASGALRPGE